MKKLVSVILLICLIISPFAQAYSEDVEQLFGMTANISNNIKITFRQSSNPSAECDRINRSKGFGGFGYPVQACSFWIHGSSAGDSCLIITGYEANIHILGHEIRHCIQGNFHK